MADEHVPSEEELRKALDRLEVADVLLSALTTTASLGFRRVSSEAHAGRQAHVYRRAYRGC